MQSITYNKGNIILAIALALVTYGLKISFLPRLQNWLFIALLFFTLLNIVLGWVAHRKGLDDRQANTSMMLTIIIRLFTSLIFILIYLLVSDIKDIVSVIFFLFYYLLFMVFEIYHLVHKLRVQKQ